MPFAVCVIASGSSGNCVLVKNGPDAIIVDCGISKKRVQAAMAAIGVAPETVRGIVVTHEHRDHSAGVGVLSRWLEVPVYATHGTHQASAHIVKNLAGRVDVQDREPFAIGSLVVDPFPTFHDAAEPFALVIRPADQPGPGLAVVTDLGFVSTLAFERLRGVRTAVFETNHDKTMLMEGPYPWELKQRVGGRQGHLDNLTSARALARLWEDGLRQVLLAHLSEVNNHPDVVMRTLQSELPPAVMESTRFFLTYPDRHSEMVPV
jgi:phosphoribosyl 1,2-cyclic phosphodiesterase